MSVTRLLGPMVLGLTLLLIASLVSGCAGLEPYEPRDDREEGPKQGLISGEAGEFVIRRQDKGQSD